MKDRARAVDIVQPDICAVGGLSEAKKVADMAAAFGVRCVPHVWGTGVGLATALQLLAVLPHNPPRHTPLEQFLPQPLERPRQFCHERDRLRREDFRIFRRRGKRAPLHRELRRLFSLLIHVSLQSL